MGDHNRFDFYHTLRHQHYFHNNGYGLNHHRFYFGNYNGQHFGDRRYSHFNNHRFSNRWHHRFGFGSTVRHQRYFHNNGYGLSHRGFYFGHYYNGQRFGDRRVRHYRYSVGHGRHQQGYSVYHNSQFTSHGHRLVRKHDYPVVYRKGIYYGTNNGRSYRKVFFSNGQFWSNHDGHKLVMPVRRFNGYPVVWSDGCYWGSGNGRDYFAVDDSDGHYYLIQHRHLHMRLHLAHHGDARVGRKFQGHTYPVV